MCPMSIRPKGKAKDVFDNIMGKNDTDKKKTAKLIKKIKNEKDTDRRK